MPIIPAKAVIQFPCARRLDSGLRRNDEMTSLRFNDKKTFVICHAAPAAVIRHRFERKDGIRPPAPPPRKN
ncbi:MAG: hypothetical protein Q4G70_04500 [Pseudomonadota bacterium]|nr:hypothetical protein [Pseudomonadota bacterium]